MVENEIRSFLLQPTQDRTVHSSSNSNRNRLKCLENLFRVDRQGAVLLFGDGAPSCDIQLSELRPYQGEKPVILTKKNPPATRICGWPCRKRILHG
jgi:hypothetical protein